MVKLMNNAKFPCVIEPSPEGGYDAYALDLGVFAVGKESKEAALESLRKGLALHLLELSERGEPLPWPSTSVDYEGEGAVVWVEPAPLNPSGDAGESRG